MVVHNGNYPIRYYMFLFPDTPQFETNLGEPLLLTPHIQRGNIEEARQDFIRVKGRVQSTVVSV